VFSVEKQTNVNQKVSLDVAHLQPARALNFQTVLNAPINKTVPFAVEVKSAKTLFQMVMHVALMVLKT